jgi:hypothetical protein
MVGGFPELEDELCSFEPGQTNSPDRLDAMVWGLTDLMIGYEGDTSFHVPIVTSTPSGTYQPGLPHVLDLAVYDDMSKPGGLPPARSPRLKRTYFGRGTNNGRLRSNWSRST